jgi:hypothetical protein
VPLVGHSGLWGIIDFLMNGREILQRGYDQVRIARASNPNPTNIETFHAQYRSGAFKVRRLGQYMVCVSGRELVEELRKAPEDVLSLHAHAEEVIRALGHAALSDSNLPFRPFSFSNMGIPWEKASSEIFTTFLSSDRS